METVREVLSLAGKLHHTAYVIRPGRYFVHKLLRLANLHLSGEEMRGVGDAWVRLRKVAEAERQFGTNAGIHGGRGLVEMVREPEQRKDRGMANLPVRPVGEAGTVEMVVFGRIVPGGGRVLLRDRLVVEI